MKKPNQITRESLPFMAALISFFLLSSCSTIHKISNTNKEKEATVDKSTIIEQSKIQTVTFEKADTTIVTKADTTALWLYVPDDLIDPDYVQTIESNDMKLSIRATPVYKDGKKTGVTINTISIKKKEEFKITIDKTTVTNTEVHTQTNNNISQQKATVEKSKSVDKKPNNLILIYGMIFLIILLALYAFYQYLKNQYK